MTSRELVRKTFLHEPVERLPRNLWMTPYIWMFRKDEMDSFLERFPEDIIGASGIKYGKSPHTKGVPNRIGTYTDEFGCEWHIAEDGICGEVKEGIIKTPADLEKYEFPWEILDNMDCSGQAESYRNTDKFIYAGTCTRPFERMQFLCGTEELFIHIGEENQLFLKLRERLHEFNLREIKLISQQAVDAVSFMDDWGSQISMLINPAVWRKYFKPMYKEYCDIIHAAGKFTFFHSDGFIEPIFPDLIEVGIDSINSQLFCMDMEKLGELYAGKITWWGEIDRQHALPRGSEEDVRNCVRRMGDTLLKKGRTGMIANLSWEKTTSLANVLAAYDEFDKL